ncbi:MAG: hypothetical protein ACJ75R_06235 [Solirubrobacterales bacterium]
MTTGATPTTALDEFAKAHGLTVEAHPDLPTEGALLGESDLECHGAVSGALPGGEPGTVAHLSYTYRSNDHTHTVERTAVILRVPESIGFAPYLGTDSVVAVATKARKLDGGASVRVADGVDDGWLTEVFSPALSDWLARSPADFKWELANGVLCASRDGYRGSESDLEELCSDATHLARTIREQSLQEVDSGEAPRTAAKSKADPTKAALLGSLLPKVQFDQPPSDVAASRRQFHEHVVRHPSIYVRSLFLTLAITVAVNIIGGGIFGLLLNLPSPGRAVLIFEAIVLAIVGYFVVRGQIRGATETLSTEAFWLEYARSRKLTIEDPLRFAATHAKAELPGSPTKVLTGTFDGVQGSLMLTGDGFVRGDSVALVAGEQGPVASAPFEVSAPGVSVAALDSYAAKLAAELKAKTG